MVGEGLEEGDPNGAMVGASDALDLLDIPFIDFFFGFLDIPFIDFFFFEGATEGNPDAVGCGLVEGLKDGDLD
jgi:hypothetical protein